MQTFRIAWGAVEVSSPEVFARLLMHRPLDRRERVAIRVLGTRQVLQGVATELSGSATATRAGARVDAAHAATMLALALVSRRHRRLALCSAVVSTGLVGAAWLSLPA